MAKVVHIGNQGLRKKTETVTEFNEELKELAKTLTETMYDYSGLGLAANQIGVDKAICVIDVSKEKNSPEIFVNPEILDLQEEKPYMEGCLSIPGVQAKTKRATKVKVKYQDLDGNHKEADLEGLKAIAMQHEVDHLNGKLYIDQLGNMQQAMLVDKHRKYLKATTRRKF